MKKIMCLRAVCMLCAAAALSGCGALASLDAGRAVQAGMTALSAAQITDQQIVEMSRQSMVQTDAQNQIAPPSSPYVQRLARLTAGMTGYDGLNLNFKVYITPQVNAFASGDGSVRVYSGLMDAMDDDQLMAIIGHEIGHVKNHDTKDAVKKAYLNSAARQALGAVGGAIGQLSDSTLGDIAESYLKASYSRKQESEADDYGFAFTTAAGRDPYSMARAMQGLLKLSGTSSGAAALAQAFSSHPDTAEREKRMREKADAWIAARK